MQKINILTLLLLVLSITLSAQSSLNTNDTLVILNLEPNEIKNGVFNSYSDFRLNQVNQDFNFDIRQQSILKQLFLFGKPNVLTYYNSTKGKYSKYKEPHYGVCHDGQVYIKYKKSYFPLEHIRKYSIFVVERWGWRSQSMAGQNRFSYPQQYTTTYIFLPEKNLVLDLNKQNVKKLLDLEQSSLLKSFEEDKVRYYDREKLIIYLSKLNDEVEETALINQ